MVDMRDCLTRHEIGGIFVFPAFGQLDQRNFIQGMPP